MKVLTVVGNRPQFVKSAPLSKAFRAAGIDDVGLHTGQHYDPELSQVFFEELELPEPRYSLDLRTADPGPMQAGIGDAIERERPNWVVVLGDTNSTAAGSRAAVAAGANHAHVEAGLRSGDASMPEERNRVEVDRVAELLFAPDDAAGETLRAEGVPGRVEVVGDVMLDASLRLAPIARERSRILDSLGLEPGAYVVATVHREANAVPERLARIFEGLAASGAVFPVHPRTRKVIEAAGLSVPDSIRLLEPLGYLDFAALASQARAIATDSGGLQKEAYWYGVPCVTLRDTTEWTDTVEHGGNVLVGDNPSRIAAALATAEMPENPPRLYGDGRAAERVAELLVTLTP